MFEELKGNVESLHATVEERNEQAEGLLEELRGEFDAAEESREKRYAGEEEERKASSDRFLSEKNEEWKQPENFSFHVIFMKDSLLQLL